jgi:hypothetical protein
VAGLSGNARLRVLLQEARGIIVLPNLYRVNKVLRFSVGEHPFCYEVRAEIIHLDARNNARTFTGKHSIFHYYDEDNDGRFETFEWGNSDSEPKIPEWVLKELCRAVRHVKGEEERTLATLHVCVGKSHGCNVTVQLPD